MTPQVDLFSFVFWRKSKTPKKPFRYYLTFSNVVGKGIKKREDKQQTGHDFPPIFFGAKYDLIQVHRQIIHLNARIIKITIIIPLPPAIFV